MTIAVVFIGDANNVLVYGVSGDILRNISVSQTINAATVPVQISCNNDASTIVIAHSDNIITIVGDSENHITLDETIEYYEPISLEFSDNKFRLHLAWLGLYYESTDGVSWVHRDYIAALEAFFSPAVLFSVDTITYKNGVYYLVADVQFPYYISLVKTTNFADYTLVYEDMGYVGNIGYTFRKPFPAIVGDYAWFIGHSTFPYYWPDKVCRITLSSVNAHVDFPITGTPAGPYDVTALFSGPLIDGNNNVYVMLLEELGAVDSGSAYRFNGTSFARDETTTTSPCELTEYLFVDVNSYGTYKLSPIGTIIYSYSIPPSIAVLGPDSVYYLIQPAGYTYAAAIAQNFVYETEFWTEEDTCVETEYTY